MRKGFGIHTKIPFNYYPHSIDLFLSFCDTATSDSSDDCFTGINYVQCTSATDYHPSACDCTKNKAKDDPCYVKLTITRNCDITKRGTHDKNVFSINDGVIGPTIVVHFNQIIAVDVINNIPDKDTSIHWHGMHQNGMPWMDGVGMVTQWSIPRDGGKFR